MSKAGIQMSTNAVTLETHMSGVSATLNAAESQGRTHRSSCAHPGERMTNTLGDDRVNLLVHRGFTDDNGSG